MTTEKKITISRKEYTDAFVEAIKTLYAHSGNIDPSVFMGIQSQVLFCQKEAWKILERGCDDDD